MADTRGRLSPLDASFLYLERPGLPMHVGALCRLERPIHFEELVEYVGERLPLVPHGTRRVVQSPLHLARPSWDQDPRFDLRNHVLRERLRGKGDEPALAALCTEILTTPLDRSRPLWEIHLVEGAAAGPALLLKMHHALIGESSGLAVVNALLDPSPRPSRPSAPQDAPDFPGPERGAVLSWIGDLADTLGHQVRTGVALGRSLRDPSRALDRIRAGVEAFGTLVRNLSRPSPPSPLDGPPEGRRTMAWARLSHNEVRAVRNRLGGTVNDVLLSVIAGALGHYLADPPGGAGLSELRILLPGEMSAENNALRFGTRAAMLIADLPLQTRDPLERLRQVAVTRDLLRTSGETAMLERVVSLTDLLPSFLQAPLVVAQAAVTPVSAVCTSVPGPREARYMRGTAVVTMVPFVPLPAEIGLGFSLQRYADTVTLGINADTGTVRDPWRLAALVGRAFEELWSVTGLERVATREGSRTAPVRTRAARAVRASRRAPRSRS